MAEGGRLEDTKKKTEDERSKVERIVEKPEIFSDNQILTDKIDKTVQDVQTQPQVSHSASFNKKFTDSSMNASKLQLNLPKRSVIGSLVLSIPKQDIDINNFHELSAGFLKCVYGLEEWDFLVSLYPQGNAPGYVSISFRLIESPSQLSEIFPGSITVRVNLPMDERKPLQEYTHTIEPGTLRTSQPSVTNDLCPHSVFRKAQGFGMENYIVIEVTAEASKKPKRRQQVGDWLMRCESFESLS